VEDCSNRRLWSIVGFDAKTKSPKLHINQRQPERLCLSSVYHRTSHNASSSARIEEGMLLVASDCCCGPFCATRLSFVVRLQTDQFLVPRPQTLCAAKRQPQGHRCTTRIRCMYMIHKKSPILSTLWTYILTRLAGLFEHRLGRCDRGEGRWIERESRTSGTL